MKPIRSSFRGPSVGWQLVSAFAMPLRRLLHEGPICGYITLSGEVALQLLAFVIDGTPQPQSLLAELVTTLEEKILNVPK